MTTTLPQGVELDIDPRPFMPGDRVLVWCVDPMRKDVPGSGFRLPGTIVCRYGYKVTNWCDAYYDYFERKWVHTYRYYPDLVDIQFDNSKWVSKAHFTKGIEYV